MTSSRFITRSRSEIEIIKSPRDLIRILIRRIRTEILLEFPDVDLDEKEGNPAKGGPIPEDLLREDGGSS